MDSALLLPFADIDALSGNKVNAMKTADIYAETCYVRALNRLREHSKDISYDLTPEDNISVQKKSGTGNGLM
jgi:hypothetical protein